MSRSYRLFLLALVIAVGMTLLFWLPLWQGGGMIGGDIYSYYMPQKVIYAEQIRQGVVPLWHPLTGHGYPLLAESQAGVFYPVNLLLYAILPINAAYSCSHLLHYVLTFLFTWMFARKLKQSNLAALLAALIFTYGWFPVRSCLEWAIVTGAWIQLALWAVESFLQSRRYRYLIGLSLILGVQLLAGHFNIAFLTYIILFVYVVLRVWFANEDLPFKVPKVRRLVLLVTTISIFCGFLLSAVQLIPTWELKKQSQRNGSGETFNPAYGHIPIWYWTQTFSLLMWYQLDVDKALSSEKTWTVPAGTNRVEAHLYFGMIPFWLVAGVVGLAICRRCSLSRQDWAWVIIAVGSLVYSSGWLLAVTGYLPGFSFFQGPGRWGIITTIAVAMLAGSFADKYLQFATPKFSLGRTLLFAVIFLFTTVEFWQVNQWIAYGEMVEIPPINYRPQSQVRDLLQKYETAHGIPRMYSPGANVADLTGFAATPTYLGLSPLEYSDKKLIMPEVPESLKHEVPIKTTKAQVRWLQKAGVTHILCFAPLDSTQWPVTELGVGMDSLLNEIWGRYDENEPVFLYELQGSRGRVAFVEPADDRSAKIVKYELHKIVATVNSTTGGKIVLTDLAYPGWTVTIDDQPAEALVVEGMFRGVQVPAGEHTVTWSFEPNSFRWGAAISLLMLCTLATFAHISFWHPSRLNLFARESD